MKKIFVELPTDLVSYINEIDQVYIENKLLDNTDLLHLPSVTLLNSLLDISDYVINGNHAGVLVYSVDDEVVYLSIDELELSIDLEHETCIIINAFDMAELNDPNTKLYQVLNSFYYPLFTNELRCISMGRELPPDAIERVEDYLEKYGLGKILS